MTRQEVKNLLWTRTNEQVIDEIFDHFEQQLKEKDERIKQLETSFFVCKEHLHERDEHIAELEGKLQRYESQVAEFVSEVDVFDIGEGQWIEAYTNGEYEIEDGKKYRVIVISEDSKND